MFTKYELITIFEALERFYPFRYEQAVMLPDLSAKVLLIHEKETDNHVD